MNNTTIAESRRNLPGRAQGAAWLAGAVLASLVAGCTDDAMGPDQPGASIAASMMQGSVASSGLAFVQAVVGSDVATGGGGVGSVTTEEQIEGGGNQLYIAHVNVRTTRPVSSITGGGLTWELVASRDGDRGVVRTEVWKAFGSPEAPFKPTANFGNPGPFSAVLTVTRYVGADPVLADVRTAGTGGSDNDNPVITTESDVPGSKHFVALNPRHRLVSAADPDFEERMFERTGTGGSDVGGYTADHLKATAGQDTFDVTLSSDADWGLVAAVIRPDPAPVSHGLWITKEELDQLPTSGEDWDGANEPKGVADSSWDLPIDLHENNIDANVQVMAGALVFARLWPADSAGFYRVKVADYLEQLIYEGFDTSTSALRWCRNIGSFVIAADLVNLPAFDPGLDADFRAFVDTLLTKENTGSGMNSVLEGALVRPNNIGNWCRWSAILISSYLDDQETLDNLVAHVRYYLGDRTALAEDPFSFGTNQPGGVSWQEAPEDEGTWRGVVRQGVSRDGNNFDGILPDDIRRGDPHDYDSTHFPNLYGDADPAGVRYVEEALDPVLGTLVVLNRLGHPAHAWSDDAAGRAVVRLKFFADQFSAKGWVYFTTSHEASRPLVNYLYGYGYPENRERSQLGGAAKGFGFTHWSHPGDSEFAIAKDP